MKLNLLYWKCLLDIVVEKMFNTFGSLFTKTSSGIYVFSGGWSEHKMHSLFESCLKEVMCEVISRNCDRYDKFIVISSCWPKDNMLLSLKDSSYFPKKLDLLIKTKPGVKYLLREKDICIDIESLNRMFIDAFNKMFNDRRYAERIAGNCSSSIVFLSHSRLDCYALFKIVKHIYGSSNCVNIWKEKMSKQTPHLVAVNDLISKYIAKKTCMNRSQELKACAKEVKDYLKEEIGV